MWYVLQTKSGEESIVKNFLERWIDEDDCKVILPLYEDVWCKGRLGHIQLKRFFPGYLFLDMENPREIIEEIRRIPKFKRLLSSEIDEGTSFFLPVGEDDRAFLESITENGVMRVSYIQVSPQGGIERIIGPLKYFEKDIVKLNVPCRRAIVETEVFGKLHRLKFSLWTSRDPGIPWIERALQTGEESCSGNEERTGERGTLGAGEDPLEDMYSEAAPADKASRTERGQKNIGARGDLILFQPGDEVEDTTGIYGDMVFHVVKVDTARQILHVTANFLGTEVRFELKVSEVKKV